jgi:xanthine dehydrogenase YagT iron-sulfur-binding subunit
VSEDPRRHPAPAAEGGTPHEPAAEPTLSVSRRIFLKSVSAAPIAAAALAPGEAAAQAAETLGPGPVPVSFVVNGTTRSVTVEPRVTLLDALRNQLDLTGAKRVCDRGSCGACTVHLDGRPVYACSVLAVDAAGANIRTIEGLTEGTVLHPVQQAFCEKDGLMCGFCTPGFVMATVALLERVPNPTPEQARKALDGNICRCGTYVRVLEAALSVNGGSRG